MILRSARTTIIMGLLTLGLVLPTGETISQQTIQAPPGASALTAVLEEACVDFIKGLIKWGKDSPPNEDRYVWFVFSHSQATSDQIIGYARGRLDYKVSTDELSGHGNHYMLRQPSSVSTENHTLGHPYAPPPEPPTFTLDTYQQTKVRLKTASPSVLFAGGMKVSHPRCRDGVMYGWEDVPEDEDPKTYPRTFVVINLNKMSALPPITPPSVASRILPWDIVQAQERIAVLERLVGKLVLENDFLKRPSRDAR